MSQGHRIHFVGIGGIGMSGIAEVLLNLGYSVSGSDLSESDTTERLISLGAHVVFGHDPDHVDKAVDAVVISSAVKFSNPEVARARDLQIPVIPRAEMLAELMRMKSGIAVAGTHGKTTTTSLLAQILSEAGMDPTTVIGGKVHSLGSNARLGEGEYLVAEADESDGTFLLLSPTIAVITNIDPEHLEHWGSVERAADAFLEFANRVPFYGTAILGVDSPRVAALVPRLRKRFLTYGLTRDAEFSARDLRIEGLETRFVATRAGEDLGEVRVASPGRHIAMNALATIAVCLEIGVPFPAVAAGLAAFTGIHRRFEIRGRANGVTVVDDYGHHPEEVRATLRAAREGLGGRRIVVFQPHRYSRTRDLFEDFLGAFDDADHLLLIDIHAAGEEPIDGVDAESLARALARRGHADVRYVADRSTLGAAVTEIARPDDVVLLMGAGDIIRDGDGVVAALSGSRNLRGSS
ncbi:MAG: UDP-N-acetylmuramate--L-alanine ligase [Candidatus Binatia bacterium]|nr:UDP-N-acetylmuramate--L-alanine ligase [Candidatus Binatia bacterium]MDG2011706.1 UDP-N-acetylmuramate--L-alanine ligase [Candidatus Binatia bacterium]